MRRPLLFAVVALTAAACHRWAGEPSPLADAGMLPDESACLLPPPAPPLAQCPPGDGSPLDRAVRFYDEESYEEALACAVQAAAAAPEEASAHVERAFALAALGRLEEARVAHARALAVDPDHLDALLGAASLYLEALPPSRDFTELGLAYAARGRAVARRRGDRSMAAQFAVLEAVGLNDVGKNREALARADEALARGVEEVRARRERATALFELGRLEEARGELAQLVDDPTTAAWAHTTLGLIAERENDAAAARREIARGRELDPEAYPPLLDVSPQEFERLVREARAGLAPELAGDLAGIPVTTQELPDDEDLAAVDPPLSPGLLGLFRGPSLGESCEGLCDGGPCRSIVLYRRNHLRAAHSRPELERQVKTTLVHEIGHLRGESDVELIARGLE